MIREKKPERILWKKLGNGTLTLKDGRTIQPNEKFRAFPDEISQAFRDTVIPLEDLPKENEKLVKEITPPTSKYLKVQKSSGWFDVVNIEGKTMNETSLREAEANKLIASLEDSDEMGNDNDQDDDDQDYQDDQDDDDQDDDGDQDDQDDDDEG